MFVQHPISGESEELLIWKRLTTFIDKLKWSGPILRLREASVGLHTAIIALGYAGYATQEYQDLCGHATEIVHSPWSQTELTWARAIESTEHDPLFEKVYERAIFYVWSPVALNVAACIEEIEKAIPVASVETPWKLSNETLSQYPHFTQLYAHVVSKYPGLREKFRELYIIYIVGTAHKYVEELGALANVVTAQQHADNFRYHLPFYSPNIEPPFPQHPPVASPHFREPMRCHPVP